MAARKRTSLRARAAKPTSTTKSAAPHLPLPEDIHLTHPERAAATESSSPSREPPQDPTEFLPDAADVADSEEWRLTKKDKRQLKRGLMLQRVRDAGITKPSSSTKKVIKRKRRPGKKLKTDLDGLADALPSVDQDRGTSEAETQQQEDDGDGDEWEGLSDHPNDEDMNDFSGLPVPLSRRRRRRLQTQDRNIIRLESLPHRRGAMKKKRKLEGREMDRFARNLAQMVDSPALRTSGGGEGGSVGLDTGGGEGAQGVSVAEKWAALRRFIGGTMETAKEFEKKKSVLA